MAAAANNELPGRAVPNVVPPLVVDASVPHRMGGAGFGFHLCCCALISTVVSRHFTGRYVNDFGIWLLLLAAGGVVGALPGISRLWVDDQGVRRRAGVFISRACWADVTAISVQRRRVGKFERWGVLVDTRRGGMFISDMYSVGRAELAAAMTQRWCIASPDAPSNRMPAHGGSF